jgi:hypothetical protein
MEDGRTSIGKAQREERDEANLLFGVSRWTYAVAVFRRDETYLI